MLENIDICLDKLHIKEKIHKKLHVFYGFF